MSHSHKSVPYSTDSHHTIIETNVHDQYNQYGQSFLDDRERRRGVSAPRRVRPQQTHIILLLATTIGPILTIHTMNKPRYSHMIDYLELLSFILPLLLIKTHLQFSPIFPQNSIKSFNSFRSTAHQSSNSKRQSKSLVFHFSHTAQ